LARRRKEWRLWARMKWDSGDADWQTRWNNLYCTQLVDYCRVVQPHSTTLFSVPPLKKYMLCPSLSWPAKRKEEKKESRENNRDTDPSSSTQTRPWPELTLSFFTWTTSLSLSQRHRTRDTEERRRESLKLFLSLTAAGIQHCTAQQSRAQYCGAP
jgi:hypothetical protein